MYQIKVKADLWQNREHTTKEITIQRSDDGCVTVDGRKWPDIEYNGIQLRFELHGGIDVYIVFDSYLSGTTIKEIHEQLVS